jgi:hypothetical protein
MTMPKQKPPTHSERFDALVNNIGAAPCLTADDVEGTGEIEALHTVITALWLQLSEANQAKFFADADIRALEAKAEQWANEELPDQPD